jgi:hypothetical protein
MQIPATTKGHKGKFKPTHPEKYHGDVSKIIFRSTWELKVMRMLDTNVNVLNWASEELVIPYVSPIDGQTHRYFPDFVVKVRMPNSKIVIQVIEVKPHKQTMPPVGKRKTKRLLLEQAHFAVNDAKWKAAREFCADRKWEFIVLTEYHLGLAKPKP